MRTSVDDSTASKCVTGIYTSNYNVTFYDMDYNNNIYIEEYAVKITNQSINGSLPIPSPTSTPSTLSSISTNSMSPLSPITLYTDCDNSSYY